MCHLLIRTTCPSCHLPTAYPQRNRVKPCFPPKVYTGWAPATAMYEKHRTEEKTIPDLCDHCRYRGLWTWYGKDEGEGGGECGEDTSKDSKDVEGDEVEEEGGMKRGRKGVEVKEGGTEVEGKKVKGEKGKGKWAKKERVGGEEKGSHKEGKEEKKVPRKGKRKAGEDVDQQEVEYKRWRFP